MNMFFLVLMGIFSVAFGKPMNRQSFGNMKCMECLMGMSSMQPGNMDSTACSKALAAAKDCVYEQLYSSELCVCDQSTLEMIVQTVSLPTNMVCASQDKGNNCLGYEDNDFNDCLSFGQSITSRPINSDNERKQVAAKLKTCFGNGYDNCYKHTPAENIAQMWSPLADLLNNGCDLMQLAMPYLYKCSLMANFTPSSDMCQMEEDFENFYECIQDEMGAEITSGNCRGATPELLFNLQFGSAMESAEAACGMQSNVADAVSHCYNK